MEEPHVVAGKFALSFSVKFLSFFVHNSGSSELITWIWVSLEKFLLLQNWSTYDANLGHS